MPNIPEANDVTVQCLSSHCQKGHVGLVGYSGIILCMHPANERRCYNVTLSLIGWAHTQNEPWISLGLLSCSATTIRWKNRLLNPKQARSDLSIGHLKDRLFMFIISDAEISIYWRVKLTKCDLTVIDSCIQSKHNTKHCHFRWGSINYFELEQLECLHSENTPCRPMITHTMDSYQDKVKITNLKSLPKIQILEFWHKLLNKMCKYEMDPASIVEVTEWTGFCPQTDGQTDGRCETSIPPFQLPWSGG